MRDIANAYPNAVPAKVHDVSEGRICLEFQGFQRWFDNDVVEPMGLAFGIGAEGFRLSVPKDDGGRMELVIWFEMTERGMQPARFGGSTKVH